MFKTIMIIPLKTKGIMINSEYLDESSESHIKKKKNGRHRKPNITYKKNNKIS